MKLVVRQPVAERLLLAWLESETYTRCERERSGAVSQKPIDPARESVEQGQRETTTYDGQQGYGVEYEDGKYRDAQSQETPDQGRSGSFETNNLGGYGTGQPDADGQRFTSERSSSPPDPEAEQGQGGQ